MKPKELKIRVTEREGVTGLLYPVPKRERASVTIVLGPGAGANQMSVFMRLFASGLAARGFDAMTFNFLYQEQHRSAPDPKAKLESCYRAVIDAALSHSQLKKNRLVIGGKSMGGRIASQVAEANSDGIAGLVFLGYPLHPPGRPDKMRDEHLQKIRAPMLFCQGARDAFGNEDEIRDVIKNRGLRAELYAIEGGDHSFKVPKSWGAQEDIYQRVMDEISKWARAI